MYPVTNKIRGNTGGKQYRLKKNTFVSVSILPATTNMNDVGLYHYNKL